MTNLIRYYPQSSESISSSDLSLISTVASKYNYTTNSSSREIPESIGLDQLNIGRATEVDIKSDLQARMNILEKKYNMEKASKMEEIERIRQESIDKIASLNNRINELENQMFDKEKMINESSRMAKQYESQIDSFLSLFNSKMGGNFTTLRDVSRAVAELTAGSISDKDSLSNYQSLNQNLVEKLEVTEAELSETKKENKRLRNQMRDVEIIEKEAMHTLDIADKYETQIKEIKHDFKSEIKSLKSIITEKEDHIQSLNSTIAALKEKLSSPPPADSSKLILQEQINLLTKKNELTNSDLEGARADIAKLQKRLAEKSEQIDVLNNKVLSLENEAEKFDRELQESEERHTRTKEKLFEVQEQLKDKETEVAMANVKLRECQLIMNESLEQKDKLCQQVDELTNRSLNFDNSPQVEELITQFENMYKMQSEEILDLTNDRQSLFKACQSLSIALEAHEAVNKRMSNKILDVENQLKTNKLNHNLLIETDEKLFREAIKHVLNIVPRSAADIIEKFDDNPKHEIFVGTVEAVVNEYEKINNDTVLKQTNEKCEDLENRLMVTLNHLNGASNFLRQMSTTSYVQGSAKTEILQHCSRIAKFLDENSIELIDNQSKAIFDPEALNDPEKVSKLFFNFVTEEQLMQSPFTELYTLFCCLGQLNYIMLQTNEQQGNQIKELQGASTKSQLLQSRLTNCENRLAQLDEVNLVLSPYLSRFIENPASDFVDLAHQFAESVNNEPLTRDERNKLLQEVTDLNLKLSQGMSELQAEKESHEQERQEFCNIVNNAISELERSVMQMRRDLLEQLFEEKERSTVLQNKIKRLEGSYEEEKNKYSDKLKKRTSEIQQLSNRLNETINELRVTQEELKDANTRALSAEQQLHTLQNKTDAEREEMQKSIEKLTTQKDRLARRAQNTEEKNKEILDQIKRQTDSLDSKYQQHIQSLQTELTIARTKLSDLEKREKENLPSKRNLQKEVARLRLAEKTAVLKYEEIKSTFEKEMSKVNDRSNATIFAAKQKFERESEKLMEAIDSLRNALVQISGDQRFSTLSNDDLIRETLEKNTKREESLECRNSVDAMRLRRSLGLSESELLSNRFRELSNKLLASEHLIGVAEAEKEKYKKETDTANREIKKLEVFKRELIEWNRWAQSLFKQLSDRPICSTPSSDIRFTLEETIIASLGFGTTCQKLESLRRQKRLLSSALFREMQNYRYKKFTLRSLILCVSFARKAQRLGGVNHPKYAPSPSEDHKKPLVPFD